jgi:pyruvate/2-oxoglutarate dehydrogenase complex dihydrolipoamide acyltransferase (E2) component
MQVTLAADAWAGVDAGVEALLDEWLVAVGDAVSAGQPLARVVLVKANLEIEAPVAGGIEKLLVAAGDTFGRGEAVALLQPA